MRPDDHAAAGDWQRRRENMERSISLLQPSKLVNAVQSGVSGSVGELDISIGSMVSAGSMILCNHSAVESQMQLHRPIVLGARPGRSLISRRLAPRRCSAKITPRSSPLRFLYRLSIATGLVAVWCRSFDSVMCSKGDGPWAQSRRGLICDDLGGPIATQDQIGAGTVDQLARRHAGPRTRGVAACC